MALNLSGLNANQQAAVAWENGPLLVLAGPGSGKTKVLTTRIVRLVSESPEKRFRILGLTFTTKAADEMRSRIDTMITDGRDRVQLGTFHWLTSSFSTTSRGRPTSNRSWRSSPRTALIQFASNASTMSARR